MWHWPAFVDKLGIKIEIIQMVLMVTKLQYYIQLNAVLYAIKYPLYNNMYCWLFWTDQYSCSFLELCSWVLLISKFRNFLMFIFYCLNSDSKIYLQYQLFQLFLNEWHLILSSITHRNLCAFVPIGVAGISEMKSAYYQDNDAQHKRLNVLLSLFSYWVSMCLFVHRDAAFTLTHMCIDLCNCLG